MIERRPGLFIAALCFLLAFLQLTAFRWGVITPDSIVQYGQAISGHYDDWHPPVTAWLWRQLLRIAPGGAAFLMLDIALYWGAAGLLADLLRRRHGWGVAALPILIALAPIPFGQVGAILKDPLMACLMLMATALLARHEEGDARWARWIALPLILLAGATRINAIFAALPLLMLAAPAGWLRRPMTFVATATGALALLFTASWNLNEAMLRPSHSRPILSLVNFDLAGIVAQGGASGYPGVDPARARAITRHCYDPRLYGARDEVTCATPEGWLVDHITRTGDSPVGIWLNAIIAAPDAWARHRLTHLNWNWRLAVPRVPDDAVYMMSAPNPYALEFWPNAGTHIVVDAARAMAISPLGRPASWLAVALGLLVVASRLRRRRIVVTLAVSALAYGGAYALVSVAPDMRYNLWTMLAAMTGLVLLLAERPALPGWRWALAIAPLAVVSAIEMGALA
jgi:hypothetical protein